MNQEILQKLQTVFPEAITEKQVLDEKTGKASFEYALKSEFIDLLKANYDKLYYTVKIVDLLTNYAEIKGIAKRHNLPCEVL